MLLGTLRDRLQVLCLGTLLLAVPPAFRLLAAKWYPDLYGSAVGAQHHHTAETLHRKFWRSALTVVTAVALVLLIRCLWKGGYHSLTATGFASRRWCWPS
jgi:hypothetical protein